jgi:tetratricopeptide (TPR) repeat protein
MTREAREACETALSSAPAYKPPFEMLESIHTSNSDWAELCSLYERRARALIRGEEAANLYIARGRIFDKNLEMKEEALASYKVAHSIEPADMRIMEIIVELCRAQNWTGELIKALVDRAGMEEKSKAAITYCEAAGILSHKPGQEGGREKLLKLAIEADPECPQSYQGLEGLYEQQGRWKDLFHGRSPMGFYGLWSCSFGLR